MKFEVELMKHWTMSREIDPKRADKEERRRDELEALGEQKKRELHAAAEAEAWR